MRDISIPAALLGQAILFFLFILVVNAVLREAARVVVRIALFAAVVLAVAVVAGWLDRTMVGRWLEQVGEWLIIAVRALVFWLRDLWREISA